jgi:DNA polymerase III subunit delta'
LVVAIVDGLFLTDGELPLPWLQAPLQALAQLRGHAVLVHGSQGRGLLPLALSWAQAQVCEAKGESRASTGVPCGRCEACQLVASHTHPDVRVVVPEALRLRLSWPSPAPRGDESSERSTKPSEDIRIDDVRALIDWGQRTPTRGTRKAVVLHPATSMNVASSSALLKTLEEPPGSLRLVLTADAVGDLLPTVASRCQALALPAVQRGVALAWLAQHGMGNSSDAAVMLDAAGGEPLSALTMVEQGVTAASWSALPKAVSAGRSQAVQGWTVPLVIESLSKLCHDMLRQASAMPPRYFSPSSLPELKPTPAAWEALRLWSTELMEQARHASHPWHETVALEALVTRAHRVWQQAKSTVKPDRGAGRKVEVS